MGTALTDADRSRTYIIWWPELEGDGTSTMTNPSSSIELPMLFAPRAACRQAKHFQDMGYTSLTCSLLRKQLYHDTKKTIPVSGLASRQLSSDAGCRTWQQIKVQHRQCELSANYSLWGTRGMRYIPTHRVANTQHRNASTQACT